MSNPLIIIYAPNGPSDELDAFLTKNGIVNTAPKSTGIVAQGGSVKPAKAETPVAKDEEEEEEEAPKPAKAKAAKPEPEAPKASTKKAPTKPKPEPEPEEEEEEVEVEVEEEVEEESEEEEIEVVEPKPSEFADFTMLRQVTELYFSKGYRDVEAVVAHCKKIQAKVPLLQRVKEIHNRIPQAWEMMLAKSK